MYRVLVDHARARGRIKRSPPADQRVPLTAAELSEGSAEEILAVEEALRRLEGHDPRLAEVARLKTFAELEDGAVARALGVSERTARRDWALARAWLQRVLSE
jgi:DNA-directed RNA polymerase specialized sigma24 family protein